jgi:hypothetical protein
MPPGVFCAGGVAGQDACSGEELTYYLILYMLFFIVLICLMSVLLHTTKYLHK